MTTPSRAARVRAAVAADLQRAGRPITTDDMPTARQAAATRRELHVILQRMVRDGLVLRIGRGYHNGDPYKYHQA